MHFPIRVRQRQRVGKATEERSGSNRGERNAGAGEGEKRGGWRWWWGRETRWRRGWCSLFNYLHQGHDYGEFFSGNVLFCFFVFHQ